VSDSFLNLSGRFRDVALPAVKGGVYRRANMSEANELLTAEQVARLLNLKTGTVYDAALKGRLPSVRLWEGRRRALVRFRAQDILKVISERTRPAKG
jgi:excisionase family DNA binding protein